MGNRCSSTTEKKIDNKLFHYRSTCVNDAIENVNIKEKLQNAKYKSLNNCHIKNSALRILKAYDVKKTPMVVLH